MRRLALAFVLVVVIVLVTSQAALAAPPQQGGGMIHYVRSGETLYSIAAQYGVSVEAILRQNGLLNPDMIYAGQALTIPGGYGPPPSPYPPNSGGYGCAGYHTVQPGETLSSIAWNYGTTTEALLRLNNLYNADFVYVGQRLCMPAVDGYYGPQPAGYGNYRPAPAMYYHTVATGETLDGICARYGVDPWRVIRANNLRNASFIWAGQRLVIPGYQPAPPPPPPLPAPGYDGPYDNRPPAYVPYNPNDHRSPYKKPPEEPDDKLPPAPDYQKGAARPLLPLSEHPVEVVINGGETWADETISGPDPNGITTVVVQTDTEFGKLIRLRSGDVEIKGETEYLSGEFGPSSVAFRYVPPGDYDVWVDDPDTPSEKVPISVDAGQRVNVAFSKQVRFQGQTFASPDGWVLSGWENPSKPKQNIGGWSNILVKTPASGLTVVAESEGGGYKATCLTGSKGPGACDFAGLMAGFYFIHIDGTQLTVKIYMDGAAYATLEFARQPVKGEENKVGPVNYD